MKENKLLCVKRKFANAALEDFLLLNLCYSLTLVYITVHAMRFIGLYLVCTNRYSVVKSEQSVRL